MRCRIAVAALVVFAAAAPAAAQMPPHIKEQLDRIRAAPGPQAGKATFDLYTFELQKRPAVKAKITRDVSYGKSSRQVLDLYQPPDAKDLPIVVFVHGGGFREGDKSINQQLFGNVPSYFARNGMLGVAMNYRLSPGSPWPAGAQDVGAAVAWLREHAARYGGDPAKIFLLGYSAGATHVASYVFDKSLRPAGGNGVAGAIVLSGLYQVQPTYVTNVAANVKEYFGADASQYDARSPLTHVPGSTTPVFVAGAQHDPPFLLRQADELRDMLCARDGGRCPRTLRLAHHTHLSPPAAFDTSDEELGRAVLEFVREAR